MKKKPSLPPLSPLPLEVLREVELIEEYVQDELERHCRDFGTFAKPEKVRRILRTGVAEALNVQTDYYFSLPHYHPGWIVEIARTTVDSLIQLFPPFISGEQFRSDLLLTAVHHLKAKGVPAAKVPVEPLAASLKAADSLGAKIDHLRQECNLTVDALAEEIDIDIRSVRRHLAGQVKPYDRHLWAYERVFSKLLKRQVVLRKMS